MASSLLTTDKRWAAPTRKSGMTVLGKIPKPINLPSQRSENHGLDPNVEIVPKGTLTWGSKPTPTTSNAWSSSSLLSPKTDGSSSSPSHISGRPSSGGGTRPSTAGSEKSLDSPSDWGPNSHPSSASSILPSQHLLTATNRPRSAETRPGSSQLSRFADSSAENVKVSIRTIDKSGPTSHGHGFTLSTGDFPTLGSEKNSEPNSQRGHSSKGRPTSSSGKEAAQNEHDEDLIAGAGEVISSSSYQHVDIIKTEHAYDGSAPFPAANLPNEAQQAQPYPPNFCMPPPQFDSWRAPPGHSPEGMWHRGAAPCGPYRPVGPPGSFPVEPYAYYGQFPPNSEAAARQGGYHPKNGDAYHPHMPPNSYIINQPVISVRPVYQGPMPYDGYYGPPRANFNNANERDSPFVGGPHQPGILNKFPNQNDKFHLGQSHSRPGKHETIPKEQLESDRVHVARRGQPRILLEHPDRSGGTRDVEKKAQLPPPLLPHLDGSWTDVNMRMDTRDTFSGSDRVLVKSIHDQRGSAGIGHSSLSENEHAHPREIDDGILRKKLKEDHSVALDQQPVVKKNATLIEKIESLNNKARNVDARNAVEPFSSKEAKEKQPKTIYPKADHVTKHVSPSAVIAGAVPASGQAAYISDMSISPVVQNPPKVPSDGVIVVGPSESQSTEFSKAGKLGESTHYHVHRRGDSSRNNHHRSAKDRSTNIPGHGRREHSTIDPSPIVDLRNVQHDQPSENASQESHVTVTDNISDLHVTVTDNVSDSLDFESQRAKMRELAAQRAKQLQAEEEERTRQQKAKALAKLEELNRRSSAHQKRSNDAPPEIDDMHDKQEAELDVPTKPETSTAESCDVISSGSASALHLPNDPKNVAVLGESTTVSHAAGVVKDVVIHDTSSATKITEINMLEHVAQKSVSEFHDSSAPKHRQTGFRRRQVVSKEIIFGEKSNAAGSTENVKNIVEASADTLSADVTPHEDPSTQNKKSSKHTRNKKKVEIASVSSKLPNVVVKEPNTVKVSSESKIQTPGVVISSSILPAQGTTVTVGSITVGDVSLVTFNQECLKAPEEAHNMANSRSRPQQTKRSGKNQHGVRPVEKPHGSEGVMWAPVKLPGQNEQYEEAGLNSTAVAAPAQPSAKNSNDGENMTRMKRAEMERYVPKPLSKELQQQSLGQALPADNQAASVDCSATSYFDSKNHDKEAVEKSTTAKAEVTSEPKKWEDKKTSRGHGKPHSSWRRRNTDESALVITNPAEKADNSHDLQNPSDQQQPPEPDKQAEKQLKSKSHDATENSSDPTQTVPLPASGAKEHGAARQRRHHVKAQRNEGSNYSYDSKEREGRTDVYQMVTLPMDSNLSEQRNSLRSEMKNTGAAVMHPRAHWKPKSNTHPQNHSQGNNAMEGQMDSHVGRSDVDNSQGFDSRNGNLIQKNGGNGEMDAYVEQVKGDMKYEADYAKSQSHEDAEQQQLNPTLRRHGGRFHRGVGMHRGRGYDAGKLSLGANAERRRGGTHFEYQPVGSNKPTDSQQNPSVDERIEGGHPASGPAYRDRGHNRGPRPAGHFVRRNVVATPTAHYQDE